MDLIRIKAAKHRDQKCNLVIFLILGSHYCQVDHGIDLDRHLTFLIECRGAFSSMNDLKEILVHSSNLLATRALRLREKKDTLNFIKSCITFNEVTIPCIPSYSRQLILYLETAEVNKILIFFLLLLKLIKCLVLILIK